MAFKLLDAKNDGRGLVAGFCGVFVINAATCLCLASLAFKLDPSTHISASMVLGSLFGAPVLTLFGVWALRSVTLASLFIGAVFALICWQTDFMLPTYPFASYAVAFGAGWSCVEIFQNLARQFNRVKLTV